MKVVGGANEFAGVVDGFGDEKILIFEVISPYFEFLQLPESAGVCDVAKQVGESALSDWDVQVSILVLYWVCDVVICRYLSSCPSLCGHVLYLVNH